MKFENFNPDSEDDEEELEETDKKDKNFSLLFQLISRFKPRLEELKTPKEDKKSIEEEKDDPTELPKVKAELIEEEVDHNERLLTDKEEEIILQSIADIHLNELQESDKASSVEVFLNHLSESGDLTTSYLKSITSEQTSEGIEQELSRQSSALSSLEDNLDQDDFFTFLEKKPSAPINQKPSSNQSFEGFSPRKKTAFEFLIEELTKLKKVELPKLNSAVERPVKQRVSQTIMELNYKVENTKEKIRLETADSIEPQLVETYSRNNPQPESRTSLKIESRNKPELDSRPKINLTDKEVIAISEKLKINNMSLKEIFQNREISFAGVKRIVQEYLTTGNFEKILKNELILHQIDFEKDPRLRDLRNEDIYVETFHTPKSVDELLEKKGLDLNKNETEERYKTESSSQAIDQAPSITSSTNRKIKPSTDAVLVLLIVFLLIILSYVLLFKI